MYTLTDEVKQKYKVIAPGRIWVVNGIGKVDLQTMSVNVADKLAEHPTFKKYIQPIKDVKETALKKD